MFAFQDIDVSYGHTQILWDISIEVTEGEIVALIGRNGVGKTTLMKAAIGLLEPDAGAITFRGSDVTGDAADRRARQGMGYVAQDRGIFPRLTVCENLTVGEQVNTGSGTTRYDEVYGYFPRLDDRREQRAGTMSGGEQQMLAIARALVGGPDLLLLDEPSEGIQPTIIEEIREVLHRINRELGTTILFVEQHLQFTIDTADRCYVMDNGRIVNELPADELRESEVVRQNLII